MKTIWKVIIIAIVAGLILAVIGLSMGASTLLFWDGTKFQTDDNNEAVSKINEPVIEPFSSIYVITSFCDVEIIVADNYGIEAVGYNMQWDWALENGVLRVTQTNKSQSWIGVIGFNRTTMSTNHNYLKIYIPGNTEFDIVSVDSNSGDVRFSSLQSDSVQINSSFGDIRISAVTCDSLKVDQNSGDFTGMDLSTRTIFYNSSFGDGSFQNATAERFTANQDSGDLNLTNCEFGDIVTTNSFGSITARDVISRGADIRCDSGDVRLGGDFSGMTVLNTSFGDIRLTTSRTREEYSYEITTKFGDVKFGGDRYGSNASVYSGSVLENHLKITSSSGDVEVIFAK